MAKTPKPKAAAPSTEVANPAQPKLDAAAQEKISAQFTEARWDKIRRQASTSHALDATGLQGLCMEMLATRTARHPDNAPAALYAACNGLLLAIGSSLNDHDVSRYEEARRTGQLVELPAAPVSVPAPAPESPSVPVEQV
jgi:hypothetical protein